MSNIFITSESFSFFDELKIVSEYIDPSCNIKQVNNLKDFKDLEHENIRLIIIDVNEDKSKIFKFIKEVKKINKEIKILLMYNDKQIYKLDLGLFIDGYISKHTTSNEFKFAIYQLLNNKKYYDTEIIEYIVKNKTTTSKIDNLTQREKEIVACICKGMNNKEISNNLYITEHTVKKHISNILSKLNLRDRKAIILKIKL